MRKTVSDRKNTIKKNKRAIVCGSYKNHKKETVCHCQHCKSTFANNKIYVDPIKFTLWFFRIFNQLACATYMMQWACAIFLLSSISLSAWKKKLKPFVYHTIYFNILLLQSIKPTKLMNNTQKTQKLRRMQYVSGDCNGIETSRFLYLIAVH